MFSFCFPFTKATQIAGGFYTSEHFRVKTPPDTLIFPFTASRVRLILRSTPSPRMKDVHHSVKMVDSVDSLGIDLDFPCSLILDIPLPSYRLASSALRALQVDAELSPLVHRKISVAPLNGAFSGAESISTEITNSTTDINQSTGLVLRVLYKATTNRMLRVAVNGFMESLGVVLGVMGELDTDVLNSVEFH